MRGKRHATRIRPYDGLSADTRSLLALVRRQRSSVVLFIHRGKSICLPTAAIVCGFSDYQVQFLMIPSELFIAVALMSTVLGASAQGVPLAESPRSTIEYTSPAAAFNALRADPGVVFQKHDGWIVARDAGKRAIWTFAPKDDLAYPAVVKRTVVERNGALMMDMGVLCGASKVVCDDFVRRFLRLNDEMAHAVHRQSMESSASAPTQ